LATGAWIEPPEQCRCRDDAEQHPKSLRQGGEDSAYRRIRLFCDSALQTGGVVVDNKARVFKVIKAPVETQDSLPPAMKEALGYDFFLFQEGAPFELRFASSGARRSVCICRFGVARDPSCCRAVGTGRRSLRSVSDFAPMV
jgi:hypothetical protein